MHVGESYPCILCLSVPTPTQGGGMQLRLDKRLRPYWSCSCCGGKIFPANSILGPMALWGKIAIAVKLGEADVAKELLRREIENAAQQHSTGALSATAADTRPETNGV